MLAAELVVLADSGDENRDDDGCGILFGVVRDSAYKIRKLAQRELVVHSSRRQETTIPEGTGSCHNQGSTGA